jgi:hypothetical protein
MLCEMKSDERFVLVLSETVLLLVLDSCLLSFEYEYEYRKAEYE